MSFLHKWLLIGILLQVILCVPYINYILYYLPNLCNIMASMWWLPGGGFHKAVPDEVLALLGIYMAS